MVPRAGPHQPDGGSYLAGPVALPSSRCVANELTLSRRGRGLSVLQAASATQPERDGALTSARHSRVLPRPEGRSAAEMQEECPTRVGDGDDTATMSPGSDGFVASAGSVGRWRSTNGRGRSLP